MISFYYIPLWASEGHSVTVLFPFTDSDHALLLFPMKKSTDPVKKNAGPAHILVLIFLFLYHAH